MGTATVIGLVTALLTVLATAIKLFVSHQAKEQTKANAITSRDLTELESGMAAVDGMQPGPVPTLSQSGIQPTGPITTGVVHDPETISQASFTRSQGLL
jgi:hypothetical protein